MIERLLGASITIVTDLDRRLALTKVDPAS
jgi:hypothetical protein